MEISKLVSEFSKIREKHGEKMYILALKHAIRVMEIDRELGLAHLKERLTKLEKEQENGKEQ